MAKVRRIILVLFLVTIVGLSMFGSTKTAHAANGNRIISKTDDLCLGVVGGSTAPGAFTVLGSCHGTPDQLWAIPLVGGNAGLIENEHSHLCLGFAKGNTPVGAAPQTFPCNSTHFDQLWFLSRTESDFTTFQDFKDLKYLTNESGDGHPPVLEFNTTADNQQWILAQ